MPRETKGTSWDGRTYWEDENGNRRYEGESWDGRKYREDSDGNREYEGTSWDGRKYREDSEGNRTYEDDIHRGTTWDGREYEEEKSGCFLTTACVEYAGLPDNCHELEMMRELRENYIRSLPEGKDFLAEYASVAPQIVRSIKGRIDRNDIFQSLLIKCRTTVALIENRFYAEAYSICKMEFENLKKKFL